MATSAKTPPQAAAVTAPKPSEGTGLSVTLDVDPRKPRLAWQGMDRREAAVSVPTQVVEVVRPGKAQAGDDLLPSITAGHQKKNRSDQLPPNRLIWTNDNLVALQTLLDERDPATRDYRYRGKVDLVYIDPPFMVQSDFVADNAIDIDLDEDENVSARKEPSLVEILAYKDTWRQGLDSFLFALRERLVLLKELLAATGSIFVHLDWHVVHYVKVLMDEVFGYECFRTEIIWQLGTGAKSRKFLSNQHNTILAYSVGGNWTFNTDEPLAREPFAEGSVGMHFKNVDPDGRRYRVRTVNGKDYKYYEDEGKQLGSVWTDISSMSANSPILNQSTGYPTQKPEKLLERIIAVYSRPGDLVLDCYSGSGTTVFAAEKRGRRWIGIDNSKYAIHLARKRLIRLSGQPRPLEKTQIEFIECKQCGNVERKEKPQKSKEVFVVRPFTMENMGVYQRAEQWQDFQTNRSTYRDEMIKVFGGEPVHHSPLLHGRKGNSWVHVGPLDAPVSVAQVWSIVREAQRTDRKSVTILSADFDTLSASEKDEIKKTVGVTVIIRIIPASAIDEVRRRLEILHANPAAPVESMAIPAFYSPLSIVLAHEVKGRIARVGLERCEIDIESFLASQRPTLKPLASATTPTAKKKLKAEHDKWVARQEELEKWLAKATSWQKFIDFWAVDWDYGHRVGEDGKPVFETDWQSFRVRRSKTEVEPLVLTAEQKYTQPGHYRVAARVTDVFGNDGIATVIMEVK